MLIRKETDLDYRITMLVDEHRSTLVATGKKSFATRIAKVQFRAVGETIKVHDKDGIMRVARKLGVTKQIAKPPKMQYVFNVVMFKAWLRKNGERRHLFEKFFEDVPAGESLHLQPNDSHQVFYDGQRLSPVSIRITPKS